MNKNEVYSFISCLSERVYNNDRNPLSRGVCWEDDECPCIVYDSNRCEIQSVRYEGKRDTLYLRLMGETVCIKPFSKILNESLIFSTDNVTLWQKGKGHRKTKNGAQLFGMDWYFDEDGAIMNDIFSNEF